MSAAVTPEALVDAILQPLGTKLANYMPVHRDRAVMVAATYLRAERASAPELAEALRAIDGGAPAKEPPARPTVGFPPSNDPEADDGSDLLREAFDEGLRRGMWEAAEAARAALAKAGVQ